MFKSIKTTLMLLVTTPLVILSIVLIITAGHYMRTGMRQEVLSALKYTANAVKTGYSELDGDYSFDGNSIFKGKRNLTEDTTLLDGYKTDDVDITIFWGDLRVATTIKDESGKRLVGTKASEEVYKEVKKGNDYSAYNIEINNKDYYAYYIPFEEGMIFAGVPSERTNKHIDSSIYIIIFICLTVLVMAIGICVPIAIRISGIIKDTRAVVHDVARGRIRGDLSKYKHRRDELGSMCRGLEDMIKSLSNVVIRVDNGTDKAKEGAVSLDGIVTSISQIVGNVDSAISDISRGAVSQTDEVDTVTEQAQNLESSINGVGVEIKRLEGIVDDVVALGDTSIDEIDVLTRANDDCINTIQGIADNVTETNNSVKEIEEAIIMIQDIASQTNLLSLNASIEAARAGEKGKGFAVVASEIQKLADASNKTAGEVKEIVGGLSADSSRSVDSINTVMGQVEVQKDSLADVITNVKKMNTGVDTINEGMDKLGELMKKCDEVRKSLIDVINNLSAIAEENAASTEETSISMSDFKEQINELIGVTQSIEGTVEELEQGMSFFEG